ncbi:MAG: class I SAM-dependent methyltransferase, partial [Elusimicrobiota bacterium]
MKEHRNFFDRKAACWDDTKDPGELKKVKEILSEVNIKRGEKLLDVGCGTGFLLPVLQKRAGKEGEIYALDFSEKMLKEARKKFGDQFKYIHSDVQDM